MADPRAYANKAQAARNIGLAPSEVIKEARPGAVFAVKDDAIVFPEERLGGTRAKHATRRVILIQLPKLIVAARPCTVSVVPCSASQGAASGNWDLLLPSGEEAFDEPKVVAYASLLQPILKSDLVKCYGHLRDSTLLQIQSMIAANLGFVLPSSVNVQPRQFPKSDDVSTPPEHAVVHLRGSPEAEH
jgi:hypothetical protein